MNHFQCHLSSPYLHSWNGHLRPTPLIELDSSLWLWHIWSHQHVVIVGEDFSSKSFNIKVQWLDLSRNHIYWNFGQHVPNKLVTKPFFKLFLKLFLGEVPPCWYSCIRLGQSDKSHLTMDSCNHVSHMITNVIIDGVKDPCFWHSDLKFFFGLKSLYCL